MLAFLASQWSFRLNLVSEMITNSPCPILKRNHSARNCGPNDRIMKPEIIDTTEQISDLVDWLVICHAELVLPAPIIYVDLEGVDLCREGSISILTLLLNTNVPTRRTCLIDVSTLGAQAFETAGAKRTTLKDILQSQTIPKVFFDVRNDSDALFAHFGVALQGVEDVQLMDSATRKTTASRRYLNGLAKSLESNQVVPSSRIGQVSWKQAKEKGERLFKAEYGGSYDIFNQRPILKDIIAYCFGDVQYLPELREVFWARQSSLWRELVKKESQMRVTMSQRPDYQPHGGQRMMASWSKDQNTILDRWNISLSSDYYSDDCFGMYGDMDGDDDGIDDWFDDGPTSCQDIINDCDYDYYYSD